MNSLSMATLTHGFPALTGVTRGRRLLATLVLWTADHSPKGTLVLDFNGVENASASFLRESVLAFRDYVRTYQPDLFPVLANIKPEIREEFDGLLKDFGEAMPACQVDETGVRGEPEVLGALDPGSRETLDMIRQRGQVGLGNLKELSPETKPSTLSNRLASLIRQGFIVPSPEPNKRLYRFVLADAGVSNGT